MSSSVSPSRASLGFLFFAGAARTRFVEPLCPAVAGSALAAPNRARRRHGLLVQEKGRCDRGLSLSCWPRAGVNDVINIPLSLKMNDVHAYAKNVNVVQA